MLSCHAADGSALVNIILLRGEAGAPSYSLRRHINTVRGTPPLFLRPLVFTDTIFITPLPHLHHGSSSSRLSKRSAIRRFPYRSSEYASTLYSIIRGSGLPLAAALVDRILRPSPSFSPRRVIFGRPILRQLSRYIIWKI